MTIREDPEGHETAALFELADFNGKHVLEIGCGSGRLTWRFADKAERVSAIDPFTDGIERAKANTPEHLTEKVEFHNIEFLEFAAKREAESFDIAILSWSLC